MAELRVVRPWSPRPEDRHAHHRERYARFRGVFLIGGRNGVGGFRLEDLLQERGLGQLGVSLHRGYRQRKAPGQFMPELPCASQNLTWREDRSDQAQAKRVCGAVAPAS